MPRTARPAQEVKGIGEAPAAWSESDLASDPHRNEEKADKVRRMFGAIAHRYDLNNRLHSFGRDRAWRRVAIEEAALRPGDTVLDVACGTGDLALAFARAGADRVIGLDFTPQMLDVARHRAERAADTRRVEWIEGDAMALPQEDASVDIVTIAFGIRNVTDPARALAEFRRVLRPGGRLVVLEFSEPRSPLIARMNRFWCSTVMPRTATWISRDTSGAYRYLPRSIETFLDREEMVRSLDAAGFGAITQKPLTFGVCVCYRGLVLR
ncbi:MAG: bifunctional demethylmenaquinone methyltransferase/2-methoxy-6-polyprenyl-1,4-benzoquinol methylase UbiE [Phycisphaeraceae bacterium]|nr:MAG: bifunctional demethylmenaquinone methyltransferase/2-methoxy-6-polyprenyl-1,4-benzoquinol methylase UbiE [Phycisphaeraceae bacterium]